MKGGSAQHNLVAKKSKADLWEEAKTGYERDKKFLAEFHGDRVARSTQVDVVVPGADSGTMDELVANGAQVKHRDNARHNRIFLWRNATQGGDFSERFDKFRLEDKVPNL